MSAGKGDGYRRVNKTVYDSNYEDIFRKGCVEMAKKAKSEPKSDYWIIDAKIIQRNKVCFDKPLTEAEAIAAFLRGDICDIVDEEEIEIIDVTGTELISGSDGEE